VLVTDHVDGRSRSAVATVRAVAAAGYRAAVTVSGGRSAAAASRFCSATVTVPRPGEAGYAAAVREELAARDYAVVLPASDAALVALGRPGAALVDKSVLPARAAAAGFRMPETIEFPDAAALAGAAADLPYPVVVKPAVKASAASVARRVDHAAALLAVAAQLDGPVVVQPFHDGDIRAVCGVIHDGALLACVHQSYLRIWPPDCGVACAAVTVAPDTAVESGLPALLAGHDGVFQLQLVDGLLIDVNPRVYGSLPLAVAAGANLPGIAAAAAQGRSGGIVRGREGVRYRWLEGDLRHVARSVRAGRLGELPALRPRRGTAHSVESVRDPGPALARLVDVTRRRLP
jgi:predicted ATP-grasp superfamily ATP-dependent carboligase